MFCVTQCEVMFALFQKGRMAFRMFTLQWRHNGRDGVLNHQPHDCLLNRLFRRRSKKTSKLRVTGLCAGNSPVTFVCLITFIFAGISVYETNLLCIPHCDAIYFLIQCVDKPTQISWAQLNELHCTTNTLWKVFRWYFNFTVNALCFVYWNCYKSDLIQIMLTHLPLDKMAAILADDNSKGIVFNENYRIPIRISLKFVPRSAIDNKPA